MILPLLISIIAQQTGQSKATPPAKPPVGTELTNPYLPGPPSPSTVMAKVNGKSITAADVDKLLWDWAGRGVTEDLILFTLIKDRAKQEHVSVTQAEVQDMFTKQLADFQKQIPAGQDADTVMREKGLPKSRLFLQIEARLLMSKIVDLKFNKSDYISVSTLVVSSSPPTPPTPQNLGTTTPPPVQPANADKAVALGKAMDIYNQLMKGADWDKVLQSSGQNPQLVQTHGALGWRAIAAFPTQTQAEFKTLKLHGYTKPVETQNGLQVFRIDGFGVDATPTDLDGLKKEYEARAGQSLAQELQRNAKVERLFGAPPAGKSDHIKKLGVVDVRVGTGDAVGNGDEVWVTYTGKLANGTVFDSNDKPGAQLFHFTLGQRMVIAGWDQGLLGMKKGGKRKLSIPYSLAYGERALAGIPAQSDLYFDVELKDILKKK